MEEVFMIGKDIRIHCSEMLVPSAFSGNKKPRISAGLLCRWVSKYRKYKFPYTILKRISTTQKIL
jgi:hypothetical protein